MRAFAVIIGHLTNPPSIETYRFNLERRCTMVKERVATIMVLLELRSCAFCLRRLESGVLRAELDALHHQQ